MNFSKEMCQFVIKNTVAFEGGVIEAVQETVFKATNARQKELLFFLLNTGARIGEVYQLEWSDIDFDRGILCLWTRKRKHGNREARSVPMSTALRALLENLAGKRERYYRRTVYPIPGHRSRLRQYSIVRKSSLRK